MGPSSGNAAEPGEGVPNHLALQPALLVAGDVREHRSSAPGIAVDGAPRRMRLDDLDHAPERQRPLGALDPHPDPLAGNRAGDEHHQAFVAGQHAPAGRGLLRHERDEVVLANHGASVSPA